jgi:hypothetical protein
MPHLITDTIVNLWKSGRKTKPTSGGWISGNAPCCVHRGETPDRKNRGGLLVNTAEDSFIWHCFNCGFKAGWMPGKTLSKNTKNLFRWMGLSDTEVNQLALTALKEKDSIIPNKKELDFNLPDINLPDNSLSIKQWLEEGCEDKDFLECLNYIKYRGLSLDDYNWHWSPDPKLQDRVIIPFYYDQRIVGWTGRKIVAGNPKYLTKSHAGYVFNLDSQTYERKYVIVVEGQIDAIGIDAVAIMHNDPTEVQTIRINQLGKEVIVVPDRDRAGAKMLEKALENNWGMSMPPWGDDVKDVADAVKKYGKIYTLSTIIHYQTHNKVKIEIAKNKLEKLNEK